MCWVEEMKSEVEQVSLLQPYTDTHHTPLHNPPEYDAHRHCPSPPPAYTLLPNGEDEFIHPPCSCKERREPRRMRLVTVLSLIIMILLSITLGVTWKHLELLANYEDEETVINIGDSYNMQFNDDHEDGHLNHVSNKSIREEIHG